MARPKTQGPVISFRLPIETHDWVVDLAAKDDLSPGEYVRRATQRSFDKATGAVKLMRNLEAAVDRVSKRGAAPLKIDEAFSGPIPHGPVFGKHPSWRLNSIGVNVCTACGEPKQTARELCMGNSL